MSEWELSGRSEFCSTVRCAPGCREDLAALPGDKFFVVDENVAALYPEFLARLAELGRVRLLAAGEHSKNFAELVALVNELAAARLTRADAVVAVGGGVTTDLAGFAAAVYLRGVRYVSVPTTLLAMVDAAIGGKCGVDLAAGKNLAGAFYQPERVLVDSDFLRTLPEAEVGSGLGEIIKYAVIADRGLLALLEDFAAHRGEIIERCIRIKCDIVAADEREAGTRMLLNFGHTVGHAIEKLGGFSRYSHGRAVATGMIVESDLLAELGLVSRADAELVRRTVEKFSLRIADSFSAEDLYEGLLGDKKRRGDELKFSGFSRIGEGKIYSFPLELVRATLAKVV